MKKKKRVLLIDDEEEYRKDIADFLEEYEFRCAGTEEEFWKILEGKKWIPDIFLIDWILIPPNERNAEKIVSKLSKDYPDIPRVVLTIGRKGTVTKVAELNCHYIVKGSGLTKIGEKIKSIISTEISKKAEQFDKEKQIEGVLVELEDLNIQLGNEKDDLLKTNKFLRNERDDLIKSNKLLGSFNNEVNKTIVDEKLDSRDCYINLIRFLVKYFDCTYGALILYDEDEKICIKRTQKNDICTYEVISFISKDLGDSSKTEIILNNTSAFNDQNVNGSDPLITTSLEKHKTLKIKAIDDLEDCNSLMIQPIVKDEKISGRILLYRKNRTFDEKDKNNIKQLPLSSIVESIKDFKFRVYEKEGMLDGLLKLFLLPISIILYPLLKLMSLVTKLFNNGWSFEYNDLKDKEFWMATVMGFLRLSIIILSLLIIIMPLLEFFKSGFQWEPVHIIHYIESIVMYFTFILFSLGLLVLLEPKFAKGLPNWMERFSHVSTLEKTLLTLVAILLAISILGNYLDTYNIDSKKVDLHLLFRSAGAFLIIIAIGIFIKLNLHGDADN